MGALKNEPGSKNNPTARLPRGAATLTLAPLGI
jgi:hypothetical protein